jgi:hypothetical protein
MEGKTLPHIYNLGMYDIFYDLKPLVPSLRIGSGSPIQKCGSDLDEENDNTVSSHTHCSDSLQA